MNNKVFRDSVLNEEFIDRGYVIVPLLNAAEIQQLVNFFNSHSDSLKQAFTTFATNNYNYKMAVDKAIKETLSPAFTALFFYHEPFWGNFFTKHTNSPAMPLHADLQYVNEPDEISFNIWCPLVDTKEENGALGIIPASHKVVKQIRGTNVTNSYRANAQKMQDKFGEVLFLKAGEAIIYDHRLLHYSLPNISSESRLAVALIGMPKGAQVVHYYADFEGGDIVKYNLESYEDLLKTDFLQRPRHLKPVEDLKGYQFKTLDIDDLKNVLMKQ